MYMPKDLRQKTEKEVISQFVATAGRLSAKHINTNVKDVPTEIWCHWMIPVYIERSRSGNGAHAWIFFSEPVSAALARKLGFAILGSAMERNVQLDMRYRHYWLSTIADWSFRPRRTPSHGRHRNRIKYRSKISMAQSRWSGLMEYMCL